MNTAMDVVNAAWTAPDGLTLPRPPANPVPARAVGSTQA
jgi:hypothetical protein